MELIHKMIPENFLYSLPRGIKFINKSGKEFLVVEKLCCPNGHSLMVDSVKIHGEPSVRLKVKIGNQEGYIFVDSYWGSHSKLFSFIPKADNLDKPVEVFCPDCGTSLMIGDKCSIEGCDSNKAILFNLPGNKNKIYVCAKVGCPGHRIDIVEIPHSVSEKISEINFFGSQDDNIFEGI